jgi:hypothetical protein
MLSSNLDTIDLRFAAATSRLSDCLTTLPLDADPATIVQVIRSVANELGGEVVFDFRTGLEFPEPVHWVATQFCHENQDLVVHVLIGDGDEPFWIGLDDELPAQCARLARDLMGYAVCPRTTLQDIGVVSGSIH